MALANPANAPPSGAYVRHQSELTLLYQRVQQHYPVFESLIAEQGSSSPHYVQQEFAAYLKCGRLEHGFLRVRCECIFCPIPITDSVLIRSPILEVFDHLFWFYPITFPGFPE